MTIMVSFIFFLLVFVGIGIASTLRHKSNTEDYLLAGRNVSPMMVALSANATWNSGFMFIGMIGLTYTMGLAAIWLAVGWLVGDYIMSLIVYKRLRATSEEQNSLTYSGVLATWNGTNFKKVRVVGGIVTLLFLGAYAAAQLNAGSKALHVLFDWDYSVGAIVGCIMVVAYCFAGGIRASIWTDAAQSIVMLISMIVLAISAVYHVGGIDAFMTALNNASPTYTNLFPPDLLLGSFFGPLLFVAGWLFAGFSVVGQPHVMVRFMTMDSVNNMGKTRLYYYSWQAVFNFITVLVGMGARVVLPDAASFDAELALPTMSLLLLPHVFVGLVLAGVFAATMSTADSQILSCSASLTRDIFPNQKESYIRTKLATIFVALFALGIALWGPQSVFELVLIAAGSLGSVFAPLLITYCVGGKPNEKTILLMMAMGFIVTIGWRTFGFNDTICYELLPGMTAGFLGYPIGRKLFGGLTEADKD